MSDGRQLHDLDHRQRRRLLWLAVLRPLTTVLLLTLAYFVLPMGRLSSAGAVLLLGGGLVFVIALCTWQVWRIVHSPTPALRSIEALVVTVPVYLLGSATTIFLLAQMDPTAFTESLTRIDALYFTLTVFATVGFGDIAAVHQAARAVVTVMIVGNLVMLAVGVKLLMQAAKWGKARRESDESD
ncbi:potassium channel family protein [Rhodococcus spongiicola]|uniref:Two pore domain potassium channel family protein n=1 Tax=Rhodococcus spongiicola TaxID=2487352 RepID=A0A3S3E3E6_9NOCA|nr:potassium channel family protein [Rhodococcus spongiicola]RVW04465.1 two pore domain potassium channel family protein [Rhodococcus spongiicola]